MSWRFPKPTIRFFAVLCVAVTSVFVMYMSYELITILSSPDWCGKALQAQRISSENFGGLTACVGLLTIQLKSLAYNSYIFAGVIAICLGVLVVIVVAGGKADITLPTTIGGGHIGIDKQTAASEAATDVAGAAVDKAAEITGDTNV